MLFWKSHNLAQNNLNFASWGCFGILRTPSCWWAQKFLKLMHPGLRNWQKRESHSYWCQVYVADLLLGTCPPPQGLWTNIDNWSKMLTVNCMEGTRYHKIYWKWKNMLKCWGGLNNIIKSSIFLWDEHLHIQKILSCQNCACLWNSYLLLIHRFK